MDWKKISVCEGDVKDIEFALSVDYRLYISFRPLLFIAGNHVCIIETGSVILCIDQSAFLGKRVSLFRTLYLCQFLDPDSLQQSILFPGEYVEAAYGFRHLSRNEELPPLCLAVSWGRSFRVPATLPNPSGQLSPSFRVPYMQP